MNDAASASPIRVRVWDVPTRLFHWLLVVGFAFSWWSAKSEHLEWHRRSGYALLALVVFRIYWGFFGSSTARFSGFIRGPREIFGYLRGAWVRQPGHNPLGALSVVALLVLLAAQIALGLFAVDVDGIESGPLSEYVSFAAGRAAAEWHEGVFDVLLWLVGLHVLAILYYLLVKRENLAAAMFRGTHDYAQPTQPLRGGSRLSFVIGVLISAALTWAVARAFHF